MKREIAVIGIIAALAVGILGGWFIPSPFAPTAGTPLIDTIESRGTIIVGTSADYPPFENYNITTDMIEGFDVDVTEMIADAMNVTVEWRDIPFDSLIGACTSGQIDMIAAAMTYDEDRAKILAPSTTYITVSQAVIVKESSILTIESLDNLTAYTVGVQSGTVMQSELEALGMTAGVDLILFARADLLIADLDIGGVDAAYVDEPIFTAFNQTYSLKVIFSTPSEPLSLWTRHGEPGLLYEINTAIFDGYQSGWIFPIITKWFG
ncbi:MAG: transporter substrate-binding domain-containing protein [Promethearchaeota archaeon]